MSVAMVPEPEKPSVRVADAVVGLSHLIVGLGALLLRWGLMTLVGFVIIVIAASTIFQWKAGVILSKVVGIIVVPLALFAMVASLGLQTGSGQPYPGPIVFILGLLLAGWAALLLYPFWRKP